MTEKVITAIFWAFIGGVVVFALLGRSNTAPAPDYQELEVLYDELSSDYERLENAHSELSEEYEDFRSCIKAIEIPSDYDEVWFDGAYGYHDVAFFVTQSMHEIATEQINECL